MKTEQIIDWYWEHGVLRQENYALCKGDWLDKVYAITDRQCKLEAMRAPAGSRATLGVWGPSQTGKSTLLSRYLDQGITDKGSPCLTWDDSAPTAFSVRQPDLITLNPYNRGNDGTGCVTRYTLASQVKHPRHPVAIRLNSLSDVMHAFACGYLSECKAVTTDGQEAEWNSQSFQDAFLVATVGKPAVASPEAYELLREVLRIVELFISTRHPRYRKLSTGWEKLRRRILSEAPALRDIDAVVEMAKKLFWDDSAPISAVFDKIREKSSRLGWPADKVYCTAQVAKLVIDIESYEVFRKNDKNEQEVLIAESIRNLGFRRQGGDILIEVLDGSPDISGESFGCFQALVREVVIPVRKPEGAQSEAALFRLLATADLLDFPGVANKHSNDVDAARINPLNTPASDHRWLTSVFKRGKTESMVLGYAKDVAIDAFALLVRTGPNVSNPRQLSTGIMHWWQSVDPAFDPGRPDASSSVPLPLSVCLTFFADAIHEHKINPDKSMDAVFRNMLGQLEPLARRDFSRLFATTYKHFGDAEKNGFRSNPEEVAKAAEFIRNDESFRQAFYGEVSRASFEAMIAEADGGVGFFLEQQLSAVKASPRKTLLASMAARDREALQALVAPALPSGDDDASSQLRIVRKVLGHLNEIKNEAPDLSGLGKFADLESVESLYAYWIRLVSFVDEKALEPVPECFSQQKLEVRELYVAKQWEIWRKGAIDRMRAELDSKWGCFGLDSEEEFGKFLDAIADQLGKAKLRDWVDAELDDVTSKNVSRSARREISVAMGNIIRRGVAHLADELVADPEDNLRTQLDGKSSSVWAYEHAVISGFRDMLATFKPSPGKRPIQPGDQELIEITRSL